MTVKIDKILNRPEDWNDLEQGTICKIVESATVFEAKQDIIIKLCPELVEQDIVAVSLSEGTYYSAEELEDYRFTIIPKGSTLMII